MATARTSSAAFRQLVGQFIDQVAEDLLPMLESHDSDLRDVWRFVDLATRQPTLADAFAEVLATTLTSIRP